MSAPPAMPFALTSPYPTTFAEASFASETVLQYFGLARNEV